MPVYTYRCENCGIQFEKTQSFSDQPLTRCPECNKKALRKVYTPVGIVFKGSGFYATDHRSPSGQSRSTEKPAVEKSGETTSSTAQTDSPAPTASASEAAESPSTSTKA